jgi:acyl dehydratase
VSINDLTHNEQAARDPEVFRTVLRRPAELLEYVGKRLGTSPWISVSQADVDDFARITGDRQWIHVDRERAAAGPYGTTIVHGFFLLSLCAGFIEMTVAVDELGMSVNAGLDRVRFLSPVPVGSRLRAHANVDAAEAIDGGVKYWLTLTIDLEGVQKPACVATVVALAYDA